MQKAGSINFCVGFLWWFNEVLPRKQWLKEEFIEYNVPMQKWEFKGDLTKLYPKYLDMAYPETFAKPPESFYETGILILLAYKTLICDDRRKEFAQEVNRRLKHYNADIRFSGRGKFYRPSPEDKIYYDAEDYVPVFQIPFNLMLAVAAAMILIPFLFW